MGGKQGEKQGSVEWMEVELAHRGLQGSVEDSSAERVSAAGCAKPTQA